MNKRRKASTKTQTFKTSEIELIRKITNISERAEKIRSSFELYQTKMYKV